MAHHAFAINFFNVFLEGVKRSAMVKKKLWAHYEQLEFIVGTYIALFLIVPILSILMSCLLHSSEIDGGVEGAVRIAIINGLKWYGIVMPIVTVLFAIWFLYYSDMVQFTDTCIQYYSWLGSKKFRVIPYDIISQCVLSGRLWTTNSSLRRPRHRKIILYNKGNIIITFDIYSKLALMLILYLKEDRFNLVSDKGNLKKISKYYGIDFMSLNIEEQLKLLKYYCKVNHGKYKSGEEILKKKKLV